jgi:hypothetical protein
LTIQEADIMDENMDNIAAENTGESSGFEDLFADIDIEQLLGLAALLSNPPPDKNIEFLKALKPVLSEERAPKVEKCVKVLKMYDLYQTLKESGMLSSLSGII